MKSPFRARIVLTVTGVLFGVGAVATAAMAISSSSAPQKVMKTDNAPHSATNATHLATGVTSFPSEGVVVSTPPGSPAITEGQVATVVKSFAEQAPAANMVGSLLGTETPTVEYGDVTASGIIGRVPGSTFAAWIISYPNTQPLLLGQTDLGNGVSATSNCTFVGIQDATTLRWVEFFQSCG
jgi:hypothetical protein